MKLFLVYTKKVETTVVHVTVVTCVHIVKTVTFSKIHVTYNDLYCKIVNVSRRSSASQMFMNNNILDPEALM